jgi:hypothetical protein
MARTINKALEDRLLKGMFHNILKVVKKDEELNLEVRTSSKVIIYYKKSKILTLFPRRENPELLSKGYWKNDLIPDFDINQPETYFQYAKKKVDDYKSIKANEEFRIQQKISVDNSGTENRYWVIDMEYQFAQNCIKNRIDNKTRFDLVSIDLKKRRIVLMELKQGMASSTGKSGVVDHINRYQEHVAHPEFRTWLRHDVKSMIDTKVKLGLFNPQIQTYINNIDKMEIDFLVVFAFKDKDEKQQYLVNYPNDKTIFIDKDSDKYIL